MEDTSTPAVPLHQDKSFFIHVLTAAERGLASKENWLKVLRVVQGLGPIAGADGRLASIAAGVLIGVLEPDPPAHPEVAVSLPVTGVLTGGLTLGSETIIPAGS
jgi:hypothetical protein